MGRSRRMELGIAAEMRVAESIQGPFPSGKKDPEHRTLRDPSPTREVGGPDESSQGGVGLEHLKGRRKFGRSRGIGMSGRRER